MEREINITRHAHMRYAARVYKAHAISDRTFDLWKKRHAKEAEELEEILKLEFQQAEFVTTAAYDQHKKADFYIRKDLMMTYVVAGDNMITCYYIDFGLDNLGNKEMLEVLFKNLRRALEEEENFERNHAEKRAELNNSVEVRKAEIQEAEALVAKLKSEKQGFELELKNIDLKLEEINATIIAAREKIVRSKKAM